MTAKDDFIGAWRITEMEVWGRDYVDLIVPAHMTFESGRARNEGGGRFRFGAVEAWMDCRYSERDGSPFVEFSWHGWDDSDETCGRGAARIGGDGEMTGRIFIHNGDDSAFTAVKGSPSEDQ